MHGKKRAEYKARLRDPKTAAALSQKAQQWHALVGELTQRRQHNDDETTTFSLIEKALLVNPDPTFLWNHRREWILLNGQNEDDKTIVLQRELTLTQASLQRNPKAYGAWFHRKWILQHTKASPEVLQTELALTIQLLQLDERNFHCWNYRRFVVAALAGNWNGEWPAPAMGPQIVVNNNNNHNMSIPPDLVVSEWEFTKQKIQDNFSNFSAFHYRSQLLPHILLLLQTKEDEQEERTSLLQEELQLIEDAVCTEPDDQTAWWYHALLLDQNSILLLKMDAALTSRLEEQADLLRELLEEASSSLLSGKWILLGLHRVLTVLQRNPDEQRRLLEQLCQVDPDRSQRYQELLLLKTAA